MLADKPESILKCSKQLPISSFIFRKVFETRTISLTLEIILTSLPDIDSKKSGRHGRHGCFVVILAFHFRKAKYQKMNE